MVFSPPIQDSIIFPRMMTRKEGVGVGGGVFKLNSSKKGIVMVLFL